MTEKATEKFDCIRFVRDVRAEIARETADMSGAERIRYYNTFPYDDPIMERLAAPLRRCAATPRSRGTPRRVDESMPLSRVRRLDG